MKNEKFLENYVRLETVLRKEDKAVIDYEATLDPERSEKLKVCRIMRNYVRHHEDGNKFLVFSDEQDKFIDVLINEISLKYDSVKSKTKKVKTLELSNTLQEAALLLTGSKVGYVPVLGKKGEIVGTVDNKLIVTAIANGSKLSSKLSSLDLNKSLQGIIIININDDIEKLTVGEKYIVIDDKSQYKGVIVW